MAKTNIRPVSENIVIWIFFLLVSLSLLSPLWVFKDLLFPFITSKAFAFRIFIELALPFYVYLLVIKKEYRPQWRNPLIIFMLAFLAISFITSFTGVNVTRSLWGNFERMGGAYYLAHLVLLTLYVVLLAQIGGKYIKYILYVAFAVAAFITLNGVSGWLHGPIVVADPSLPSRVSSTLGNPIFLGSFLILPMFLAAFFALQAESKTGKVIFWLLVVLQLVGIVLSVTRGASVGLAAGLIFAAAAYVFFNQNKKVRLYGSAIVVAAIILITGTFVFHNKLPQTQFTRLFDLQGSDTEARFLQWKSALQGFAASPIVGVGPENFYYVSNKYYDPQMIKYDASWFDKPHNYALEVLVTTGAFGFLAYMGMVVLVFWALYRGFRSGFLSLLEMSVLAAGFASYFVQNLFVFDTIPASMMFYLFVGFSAYIWMEVSRTDTKQPQKKAANLQGLAAVSAIVAGLVAIYAVYLTNVVPAGAAKDVNYGYAYIGVDITKAFDYFNSAANSSFNFDPQDTAQRFSNLAVPIAQSTQISSSQAVSMVNTITDYEKQVAQSIGNDPVSWQSLANDYYVQSVVNHTSLEPLAEDATQRAVSLAPNRLEPRQYLLQLYMAENRISDAQTLFQQMQNSLPLTGYTSSVWWLGAMLDHQAGQDQQGIAIAQQMEAQDFIPPSYNIVSWLPAYYANKKDYTDLVSWSQTITKWFPSEPDPELYLAEGYALTGQTAQAKTILQELITAKAPNAAQAQQLLNTLGQ